MKKLLSILIIGLLVAWPSSSRAAGELHQLSAQAVSTTEIDLTWTDGTTDEVEFVVRRIQVNGPFGVQLLAYNGSAANPTIAQEGSLDSFRSGASVVLDRGYNWGAVPGELDQAMRLVTSKEDNAETRSDVYVIRLDGASTIYLPLDPVHHTGKLAWMDDTWTLTSLQCYSSFNLDGTPWFIWKKEVPFGGDVNLGSDEGLGAGVSFIFMPGASHGEIQRLPANTVSFRDSGLDPQSHYQYQIEAYKGPEGFSQYSNRATATTLGSGPTYRIVVTQAANGTIYPGGELQVTEGGRQSFYVVADPGYHIQHFLLDGSPVYAGGNRVTTFYITNVLSDRTFSAIFSNTYNINAEARANGSISPEGDVAVPVGEDQTFIITPDPGYVVEYLMVDGRSITPRTSYTFTNVTETHRILVTFTEAPPESQNFTISATAGEGGTITPAGNVSVVEGQSQSFSIQPSTGYEIQDVLVDGSSIGAQDAYTFNNVSANHTIEARFSLIPVDDPNDDPNDDPVDDPITDPIDDPIIPVEPELPISKNLLDTSKGDSAIIKYVLAEAGNIKITIYDRFGREIIPLLNEESPAGTGSASWDGRDSGGNLVAPGVYHALIKEGPNTRRLKILVVN